MQCHRGHKTNLLTKTTSKMETTKFKKEVALVVALMEMQQKMTDKSDKRIVRDIIRAIVKELTTV